MKELDVVGAAIVRDGAILCARRGPGGPLADLWEFPGGKIEPNELPHDALVREIREELGCEISVDANVNSHTHSYPFARITLHTYVCSIVAGDPVPTEHSEVTWLRPSELHSLDWAPADIPAVTALARRNI